MQIDIDFDILHKGKKSMLFEKWPKIKNHIMHLLRNNSKACAEDGAYILALNTEPPGTFSLNYDKY